MQRTHLAILLSKGRTWPGVCLRKTALTAVRGGVQRRQTLEVEIKKCVCGYVCVCVCVVCKREGIWEPTSTNISQNNLSTYHII